VKRRAFLAGAGLLLSPRRLFAQGKALNLKITGLKTFVVNAGSSNWVFCKVQTNQGLTGLGEGSITSKEATLAQAIMEHERFLLGKDPTDIELLWQGMFRYPRWRGGPILNSAISAVEIALWDILGQALGVPIYKLLGGAARKRIRLYLDVDGTPESFQRAKQQGFTAAKTSGFITAEKGQISMTQAVREGVRVPIVGRPNAGKSSLANRLLGEERYVVHPEAGTTRDAVDSILQYHGLAFRFIDTAGLRRRAKVDDDLEFYSTLRTQRAIERAEVCILVVDAILGLHNQDLRIASEAWERGCGLIIAVNKWDLVPEKDANTAKRGEDVLIQKAPFLQYVPFVYISALTGQRTRKILDLVIEVAEARRRRVATSEVNQVLEELIQRQQPPQKTGEEVKLLYASQIGTGPPAFAIVSNRPDDVPESYQRYLLHGFRHAWSFTGAPIRLKFSKRSGGR